MRLHRFFVHDKLTNMSHSVILDRDILHQWKQVFRFNIGQKVILLDNTGYEYMAEIMLLTKEKAEVTIVDANLSKNLPDTVREVWLFAALIKKDNYEVILEKCTEIGVAHFVPIISDRSEKKDLNVERSLKIIKEASEQSGRGTMPQLHKVSSLEDALEEAKQQHLSLCAFHPDDNAKKFDISHIQHDTHPLGIFVGPEGGWTEREVVLFKEKNIPLYTLGSQIFRAETATIVICSHILV